ncbi:excinuclease Cho [Simplicispira psychrophila]|uniref:excinuclease Cho n=1 Tax=Simplicispira psychrophila TaxID=80882 RepID=UPI00047FF3F2|nr:excinuclease Cho [Simplicispira psychrophila]
MNLPRSRPAMDAAQLYEYPSHLREAVAGMPDAPGVYIFHGAEGDLPLYIGKSIRLRSRVLSHLRTPDEARMLRQTQRISHIRTTGEIGALLLEAQLIKQQHPLFNQKLRRQRQLCSLRVQGAAVEVVYSKDINFATETDLYGLYASRHSALEALRQLADDQRLCYGALGLEKLAQGRGCFRAQLHQCAGVCRGDETPQAHQQRLCAALEVLRIACWPYAGAVGLVERYGQEQQIHLIHHWHYLGSVSDVAQVGRLHQVAPGFDADGYKILCRPLLSGGCEVIPLP